MLDVAMNSVTFSDTALRQRLLHRRQRRQDEHGASVAAAGGAGRRGNSSPRVVHRHHAGARAEAKQFGLARRTMSETWLPIRKERECRGRERLPVAVGDEDHPAVGPVGRQGIAEDVLDPAAIAGGRRLRDARRLPAAAAAVSAVAEPQPGLQVAPVVRQRQDARRGDDERGRRRSGTGSAA